MAEDRIADLASRSGASLADLITAAHPEMLKRENDAALLTLEKRFNALAAELATVQRANREPGVSPGPRSFDQDAEHLREEVGCEALTRPVEAILAHLYPIEQAIMQMSACTIAGLGVKARHTAYLMSQYREAPMDRIDWDARAVRLLIEAVCDVARTPLPLRDVRENSLCSSAKQVCGHTLLDLPLNHPSMSRSVCAAGCDLLPELASFITSRL